MQRAPLSLWTSAGPPPLLPCMPPASRSPCLLCWNIAASWPMPVLGACRSAGVDVEVARYFVFAMVTHNCLAQSYICHQRLQRPNVRWVSKQQDALPRQATSSLVLSAHRFRFRRHVKQRRSPFPIVQVQLADEIFLGVAGDLRGRPGLHEVPGDSPPVSLHTEHQGLAPGSLEEVMPLLCT